MMSLPSEKQRLKLYLCVLVIIILYLCVLVIIIFTCAGAHNDSKDLLLTTAEKYALEKFKLLIWKDIKEPFMKTDFYLIRWIRNTNLDIRKAGQALLENIAWRNENKIENILFEDWSDLAQDYTMSHAGHDKMGRPLLFLDVGDWDLRAASIHGMTPRLHRYLTYTTEKGMHSVIQAQQEGKNVTRFVTLVDSEGFNVRKHGCPACISALIQWVVESINYYPDFTNEIIILNMPPTAVYVLNAIRAVATPNVRNQIKAFDGNKKIWIKYLDAHIDRSERTQRYGGTKA